MEGYDLDKLRSEVRVIRENTVNPRSRTTYLNSYSRFLAWAALNRQSYVSGWFIDTIGHVEDYTEQQLCAHVKQKLAQDRTTPPLDFDKLQAQDFVTCLVDALSEIESTRVATVKDIVGELEARAIGAGTVTYDGLNDAIRSCLQETGVHDLVQHLANSGHQTHEKTKDNVRILNHFWGGRFRRVPAGFHVPDCSTVWILWRCGNEAKRWPLFRLLDGRDVPDRKQQRRLSDLRFVMKKLEHDATSKNLLQDCRSIEDATNVYLTCIDSVAVESTTERSRKRRRGKLSWSTVGKLLRQAKKTRHSGA
ncbi:hypothetical protein AM587_10003041 [Phytophthora nicotianae]|uniref:Uncharacterized protein n=1 Tax=Phytophthora nicotianae TaxID=4792 RepID=A0A0W8DZ49_PHYNI|nr:hypothetical protein AM587_10003041 [Phytophthora nicotianae]